MFTQKNGQLYFPMGSHIKPAKNWLIDTQASSHLKAESPSRDIQAYFFELNTIGEAKTLAAQAWGMLGVSSLPAIALDSPFASADAWDCAQQIIYTTPTSEESCMAATVKQHQNRSYLCLLRASLAGLSKRGAELQQMTDSFLPEGFNKNPSYSWEAKPWTKAAERELELFIESAMEKLQIPGTSIAIIDKMGQFLYKNCFGVKQWGSADPIGNETAFMIGSSSKALTSLMIAHLIDQQLLRWESPVKQLLPSFQLGCKQLEKDLNLRLALSASTGMPRRDLDFIFQYQNKTAQDRLNEMQTMLPSTKIGESFQYSNYLVMAAGYAAASAYCPDKSLETAYAESLQKLVFKPLRMQNSFLGGDKARLKDHALPHSCNFQGQREAIPLDWERSIDSIAPAGAIWSTPTDLCQYLVFELQQTVDHEGNTAVTERRKPGVAMAGDSYYGLGLMRNKEHGLDCIGHDGATLGFSSHLCFYPELGIGISLLANARAANLYLQTIKQKWLELRYGLKARADIDIGNLESLQKQLLAQQLQQCSTDAAALAAVEDLVGEYQSESLGPLRIVQDNANQAFFAETESWTSKIAIEQEKNGSLFLVLVEGPLPGFIKLKWEAASASLMIRAGQEQHVFRSQASLGLRRV